MCIYNNSPEYPDYSSIGRCGQPTTFNLKANSKRKDHPPGTKKVLVEFTLRIKELEMV